jgi:hypothetical protein
LVNASFGGGEGVKPAFDDVFIGPSGGGFWVVVDDEVKVVAHDGIAVEFDGEARNESKEALFDPGFAVRVVLTGCVVDAVEEGTADAARDKVIVHGLLGIDELFAWSSHGGERGAAPWGWISDNRTRDVGILLGWL